MSSCEQKYKRALKYIQQIITANNQIKEQLETLRAMRQAEINSFTNAQKEEFHKAHEAILKEKNTIAIALQNAELENQKLKYTVAQLQNQVALYRNELHQREGAKHRDSQKNKDDRETLLPNQRPDHSEGSPRKSEAAILRQREAEWHKAMENYEEHHANLQRNSKRLQERIGELQAKLTSSDKNWRIKYEAKELEVIEIKAQARQEFSEQVALLRKENAQLRLTSSELALRLENADKGAQWQQQQPSFDWEAELVQEMIQVKANLEPLRQQIGQLQELNLYDREQAVRERTALQARVLELQAEAERYQEALKGMERRALEAHQERASLQDKAGQVKRLQQENQLLNGRIIVMESREIALRNRTGQELEERVLQFENRIELLLSNKQGLRELREVGIHQLLALKAYIMQLDSRLKQLVLSNGYLLKKYKSYKEKYQGSLREHKQYGLTINTLKMKILGYDKLVLKLQGELQRAVRSNEAEQAAIHASLNLTDSQQDLYKKKYELMREKLQVQEKYKEQEMETFKLNYETKIMELTIRLEEAKSLRETLDLYRAKNEELQALLSKRETELFESKVLSGSKVVQNTTEDPSRQTKDIILSLQATVKQNDQTIFKLQSELRSKEENHKRTVSRLERQAEELREDHQRELSRKEMDYGIALDQELKKYKLRISDLEHAQQLHAITTKDDHAKRAQQAEGKVRKLQARVVEAEAKREEEVFARRRLEKQVLDLTHDRDDLQRTLNDLQLRVAQLKSQEKEYLELKSKAAARPEPKDALPDYQLQSKDAIIKRLNAQILQLQRSLGGLGEKDITISQQKNEIYYLKKENQELHDTINKYSNEIIMLKGTIDTGKTNYHSDFANALEDKENTIARLRKELANKDNKLREIEEELSRLDEVARRQKRDLSEMERIREELNSALVQLQERDRAVERLRSGESGYEEELQRVGRELATVKESFQKVSYQLLQREDQVSKLSLEVSSIAVRTRSEAQTRFAEELSEKERECSRMGAELAALKSRLVMVEQESQYQEESYRRAVAEGGNLRGQLTQFQDQVDELSNQLYFKTQEVSKLQAALDNARSQAQDLGSQAEQGYRLRTQIFSLKSDISNLQEQVFNRQAANARLANEITYVRTQYSELEEELQVKQEYLNKLTYEYNALKGNYEQAEAVIDEKDKTIAKGQADLSSLRGKYRELQEEMEEREQAFAGVAQQLSKLKGNLTYYQQEIDERNSQIARNSNQRELLRAQITRLNQVISEKSSQVNRVKQEVFALKLEAGEKDYEQKMKIDQEMYGLKSKISLLEHEIEDRDSEIRRLHIELDAVSNRPAPEPATSEEEVQELRTELGRKQRELINMRYDLEDSQYRLETAANTVGMLKNTVNQYQERMISDREQYQAGIREYTQRERKLQEEISSLREQLELKPAFTEHVKTVSFGSSGYSEEEVAALREQLATKQRELSTVKYQLQDAGFLAQSLQSKAKMQQNLLRQLQDQFSEDRQRYEVQLQQYAANERLYMQNTQEMQDHYEQQIAKMSYEHNLDKTRASQHTGGPVWDEATQNALLRPYIEEIDRLNGLLQEMEEREHLETVARHSYSEQQIQTEAAAQITQKPVQRLDIYQTAPAQIIQHQQVVQTNQNPIQYTQKQVIQQHTNQPQVIQRQVIIQKQTVHHQQQAQQLYEKQEVHEEERNEQYYQQQAQHEVVDHEQQPEPEQEEGSSNEVVEDREHEANIKGSLIQQLQKEQSITEGSQVRGGQITIKIQPSALSPSPLPQAPFPHKPMQVHPQYIQGPNGQPLRVIQGVPQQQMYVMQPAPYPHQAVVMQSAAGPIRHNYVNVAAPVSVQQYRTMP